MSILERFTAPETQASISGTMVTGYALTLNEVIGILTVIVLLGQAGLMAPKYYKLIKDWFNKDGTKE